MECNQRKKSTTMEKKNVKSELIKSESKMLQEIEAPRGLSTCLCLPSD